MKHKPTGIMVRCHQTRDSHLNKHIALKILKDKLDVLMNGDMSKRAEKERKAKKQKDKQRRRSAEKYASKDSSSANKDDQYSSSEDESK